MILEILAIRDRAVNAYGKPLFFNAIGAAIRAFGDEINRDHADNEMYRHPEDYDLYSLGHYDDSTGQITQHPQPKQVAIGKNLTTKGA